MFSKLALQNVRKSMRDYTIYFLTLTFGVCLFYVFNSMESQQAVLALSDSQYEVMGLLVTMISGISVFISFVLGFLIVYASRFLIRRRKKELGVYMLLGMKKSAISRILVLETLVIGLLSLAVGLLIGIFASQGLAVITAKLFVVEMKEFTFIFSLPSLLKTILYFAIIYLVVIIFNTVSVSRFKLIDLLTAAKKNERLKVKSIKLSVVLFLISVACLVTAYMIILKVGMLSMTPEFWICIGLGIVGTFLFFFSLSGFILRVVQTSKKLYFRRLNMFVLRQINAKITTTFVSMTLICLMLLLTIGALSTGAALSDTLASTLEHVTPYDITIPMYSTDDENGSAKVIDYTNTEELTEALREQGAWRADLIKDSAYICFVHNEDTTYYQLLSNYKGDQLLPLDTLEQLKNAMVDMVPLSQYNRSQQMLGEDPLVLSDSEVALSCNYSQVMQVMQDMVDDPASHITIDGVEYPLYGTLLDVSLYTSAATNNAGTLIVPDAILQASGNLTCTDLFLNMQLNGDNEATVKANEDTYSAIIEDAHIDGMIISAQSRVEMYRSISSLTVLVSYLAVYIGIVFLLTCSAIIALQQLSESADNQERYATLRRIGTDQKDINRAIFQQVLISFLIPLGLAIVHSVIGLKAANDVIAYFGYTNAWVGIAASAGVVLLIYGGYMIATYFGCKAMARPKK